MKHFVFFLLLVLPFTASAQYGGPWIPHAGGGYLGATFGYWSYDKIQVSDTTRPKNLLRTVNIFNIRANAEYGATDRLMLFVDAPIRIVESTEGFNTPADFTDTLPKGTVTGLGNVEVGAKYKFYHKKWVMAASLRAELKTGQYDQKTGLRTANDAWGIVPMIHIGRSWNESFYVFADLGGAWRSDDYSGDWRIYAEGGVRIVKMFWIRAAIDSRRSFNNGGFAKANNEQTSLYVNNQEWLALNLRLEYQHPVGIGLQAGISGYFAGNNIPDAPYFSGGIFYKWDYDFNPKAAFTIEDRPVE